jgi:hypothetical protein
LPLQPLELLLRHRIDRGASEEDAGDVRAKADPQANMIMSGQGNPCPVVAQMIQKNAFTQM